MNISKIFFLISVVSFTMVQAAKGNSAQSETLKFPTERLPLDPIYAESFR